MKDRVSINPVFFFASSTLTMGSDLTIKVLAIVTDKLKNRNCAKPRKESGRYKN
jgi:hypothetical protein